MDSVDSMDCRRVEVEEVDSCVGKASSDYQKVFAFEVELDIDCSHHNKEVGTVDLLLFSEKLKDLVLSWHYLKS